MDEVLEFIERRFKKDCNWIDGNCYYFAIILKDRFPDGSIYYDTILGHFIFYYQNQFYDWVGIYNPIKLDAVLKWDTFDYFDPLWKSRITRDCIM